MARVIRPALWPLEKRERLRRRIGIAGYRLAAAFLVAMLPVFLPNTLSVFYEMIGLSRAAWYVIIQTVSCVAFSLVLSALLVVSLHGTPSEARSGVLGYGLGLVMMACMLALLPAIWAHSVDLSELTRRFQ